MLTTGWQSALLAPDILRGAIEVAARTQATTDDPFRDAEPGKMLHEARRGPLSDLEILPQRAYYGSQTTAAMFLVALSELWHWTGDDDVLRQYVDAARGAIDWATTYGDLDGDGFLEYRRRADHGPKNQGWKDSDDAIRYADGGQVPNPIATVEEQGFHYLALQRMAEIEVALGEDARADERLAQARALRDRWHEAFWLPDARFYALALDPDKRPVASIASNPGHALVPGSSRGNSRVGRPSGSSSQTLFSGWGMRTLSRDHPSYNPFSYHLGSVWPVEQATFALGCKRYGFDDLVERLVDAQYRAMSHFRGGRLPEAMSGHGADERSAPSVYPTANAPQAWNASATVQLIQILLGLYPFAPLRLLAVVRPRLPEWLPVSPSGTCRSDRRDSTLRFERDKEGVAHHEILEREGVVAVLPAPPPSAATEGIDEFGEAVGHRGGAGADHARAAHRARGRVRRVMANTSSRGQVVVVTGASAGVGRAVAQAFGGAGRRSGSWHVVGRDSRGRAPRSRRPAVGPCRADGRCGCRCRRTRRGGRGGGLRADRRLGE